MKQVRRSLIRPAAPMLRQGQEGYVRAERDILKSASLVSSPGGAKWVVRLYHSFQDRHNLYLISPFLQRLLNLIYKKKQVLEYMGGGDL